jgi:hypothetical protein
MKSHHARGFRRRHCLTAALVLFCVAVAGKVHADEVNRTGDSDPATVTSKVSATTVRVAEPLTLDVTVTAAAGSKVDFPAIGKSLGNFDVTEQVDRADVPSAIDVNQRVWTRRLTLETIVTGDTEIPSLEIQVRRDASSQTLKSEAVPIHVTSVLEGRADPAQFRDIQSVVDVPVLQPASRAWLWWTLGAVGGAAAATLLLATVAKRKTRITPGVWAIRELDQLRNSEAMKSCDSEMVIQNITMILRDFLELQFDIAAPARTSKELLQVVESGRSVSAEVTRGFAELFGNSDLALFAGLQLTQGELTKAIDDAQQLIEQTSIELQ